MLSSEMSKEKRLNPQKRFGVGTRKRQDDDNKDDGQERNRPLVRRGLNENLRWAKLCVAIQGLTVVNNTKDHWPSSSSGEVFDLENKEGHSAAEYQHFFDGC
jgi:hypothetical protein